MMKYGCKTVCVCHTRNSSVYVPPLSLKRSLDTTNHISRMSPTRSSCKHACNRNVGWTREYQLWSMFFLLCPGTNTISYISLDSLWSITLASHGLCLTSLALTVCSICSSQIQCFRLRLLLPERKKYLEREKKIPESYKFGKVHDRNI